MKKGLKIEGFYGAGEVKKAESGYDVVITIPFPSEEYAKKCLDGLKEPSNEPINLP